jgi:hypothetical protein
MGLQEVALGTGTVMHSSNKQNAEAYGANTKQADKTNRPSKRPPSRRHIVKPWRHRGASPRSTALQRPEASRTGQYAGWKLMDCTLVRLRCLLPLGLCQGGQGRQFCLLRAPGLCVQALGF